MSQFHHCCIQSHSLLGGTQATIHTTARLPVITQRRVVYCAWAGTCRLLQACCTAVTGWTEKHNTTCRQDGLAASCGYACLVVIQQLGCLLGCSWATACSYAAGVHNPTTKVDGRNRQCSWAAHSSQRLRAHKVVHHVDHADFTDIHPLRRQASARSGLRCTSRLVPFWSSCQRPRLHNAEQQVTA